MGYPVYLALEWFFGWVYYIMMFVPNWMYFNVMLPVFNFFKWLNYQIYLWVVLPVLLFFFAFPIWMWRYVINPVLYWVMFIPNLIMYWMQILMQLIMRPIDNLCIHVGYH